ncbi:MAG: zinc ribbon domain-containing protein [Thermodesulfobacteriota bacterium]
MSSQQPRGPFCQSCGMPLERPEDFGTGASGFRIKDYCRYCFQNGAFTEPSIRMQGMIDKCVGIMVQRGIMPEGQAKALMAEVIPKLKRWQKT